MSTRTYSRMMRTSFAAAGLFLLWSGAVTLVLGAEATPNLVANSSVEDAEAGAPRIVIEAASAGEPMSENIYSQFIEHLGRCIYGGIWAEMLEDRKFYFPITAEYSPYRSLREDAHFRWWARHPGRSSDRPTR